MIIQKIIDFAIAIFNLIVRIVYFFIAIAAYAFSMIVYLPFILVLVGSVGASYVIMTYHDVPIEVVEHAFRCEIYPKFYVPYMRPLLAGVMQTFFNFGVCWWDIAVYLPYGILRDVLFPLAVECGFGQSIKDFAIFLDVLLKETIVNYVGNRRFLSDELQFTNITPAFQTFFTSWQQLFCCGCNDLCAIFTKLPMFSPLSDQWGYNDTWCCISNTFNGVMSAIQEILRVVTEYVYPTQQGLPRPDFKDAYKLFCKASTCFWKSNEQAIQNFWDNFVPYDFIWADMFGVLDKMTCNMFQNIYLLSDIVIHYDDMFDHFTNVNSKYWIYHVKEEFKESVNQWRPTTYFDNITQALPNGTSMHISHYQLLTTKLSKPNGQPNPLFGMQTISDCACLAVTRVMCDPTNEGVTCAQRYAGTLLEDFDFCCYHDNMYLFIADFDTMMFEYTLHLTSVDDFIVFLDRQPFTTFLKTSYAEMLNCFYGIFRVVDTYGTCIQTVLNELTLFYTCMIELLYRITVAFITLPYFEVSLPGIDNFISRPGDEALHMTIAFLDRITSTGPDTLLSCLKFLLNTGFPVAPAGCTNGCIVDDGMQSTKKNMPYVLPSGFYRSQLNPVYDYSQMSVVTEWRAVDWWEQMSFQSSGHVVKDAMKRIDMSMDKFAQKLAKRKCHAPKLVTSPPVDPIVCDPPPACFDLSCLPSKLIIIMAHATAFGARALNAAFQTRGGMGSPYFTGTGCSSGPCLQSDLTAMIVNLIAPLRCLCNVIHLVIPPSGYADPCCFFTLLGEGLSCIVQVGLNVLTSMTNDTDYTYIKMQSGLLHDFDILLKIANSTFDCLCDFVRIIFGIVLDLSELVKNYDPCCIPTKLFRAVIEIIRMVGYIMLSLATLEEMDSQCYFYLKTANRPGCEETVHTLPILLQFDKVRAVFLAPQNDANIGKCGVYLDPTKQLDEGIATCICTLLNAVLAQVFKLDPNTPDPASCPIDLCCIIFKLSVLADEVMRFGAQTISTLWQNWEYRTLPVGSSPRTFLLPTEFIEFFFCDEYANLIIGGPLVAPGVVINPGIVTKCGLAEPIFDAIEDVGTGCLCNHAQSGLGNIGDNFLEWFLAFASEAALKPGGGSFFPINMSWPRCLCLGGPDTQGMLRPLIAWGLSFLRQFLIAMRNLNNPTYWSPAGGSLTDVDWASGVGDSLEDIRSTWIARLLTPIADEMCSFFTNVGCMLSMVLGELAIKERYLLLSSMIKYALEGLIRIIAMIEGFAKIFARELSGQCVGNPDDTNPDGSDTCGPSRPVVVGFASGVIPSDSIERIIVSLLTFIVDALIGVGKLGCTQVCPSETYKPDPLGSGLLTPYYDSCLCYSSTPYTSRPITLCNFDKCEYYGAPEGICPSGAQQCTKAEACGVTDPTRDNCPRFNVDPLFIHVFLNDCNGGCRNMTEPTSPGSVNDGVWDAEFPNHEWRQTIHPTLGIPVCHILNPTQDLINTAGDRFGDTLEINNPQYQKICRRSECIARGWCKNDQNVKCHPHDPRGVLDGVAMAALKYIRVILDDVFNGLGGLMDILIIMVSVIWQLSGGIIKFMVALGMFMFKILARSPWDNFWNMIGDTIGLLSAFFGIFTQPIVLQSKSLNSTDYVNPLSQYQSDGYVMLVKGLFGTNLDGCVNNPIPCFCTHFNMTLCDKNIETITIEEMATSMATHFDGVTECDSLVQHSKDMNPLLWSDLPYADRYLYVDCVAKRLAGEKYHDTMSDKWPKDFFYSQDGWFKLFDSMKDGFVEHVTTQSKAEKTFRRRTKDATDMTMFYHRMHSRSLIFNNILVDEKKVDNYSPARGFLVSMEQFNHKYQTGYYNYIFKTAFANMKDGYMPLATYTELIHMMGESMQELHGTYRYVKFHAGHTVYHARRGFRAIGELVEDIVYNGGKNIGVKRFHKPLPPTPRLISNYMDGTLFDGISIVKKDFKIPNVGAHIWKSLKRIELKFDSLSWMQTPNWTKKKLYNYNAFKRLSNVARYGLWPSTYHEKFIIDGNCKVVDSTVKLASTLVNYCVDEFIPASNQTTTPNDMFNRMFRGRVEYNRRYKTDMPRLRVKIEPKKRYIPKMDRHIYRRAMFTDPSSPGNFNYIRWIITVIEDLFNVDLLQGADNTVSDITKWFANPNTDVSLYPDVGFAYWLRFPFMCNFPENLNCSIGMGLEQAFKDVTFWFFVILIVAVLISPTILSVMLFFGGITLYFLIIFAVGLHYSPACLTLWPSFFGNGETLSLPTIGPTMAVPMCLMDEIVGITDKYITNNYTFMFNASMVNGPTAPQCPEYVDVVNCADVGVSDGIQNILYFMYKAYGDDFCELMINLSSTVFASIFPDLRQYMIETLGRFKTASQTEKEQFEKCALITLGSTAAVALPIIIFGLALLLLLPAFFEIISGVWQVFRTSPFFDLLVENQTEWVSVDGEDEIPTAPEVDEVDDFDDLIGDYYVDDDDEEEEIINKLEFDDDKRYDGFVGACAMFVRDNLVGGYEKVKLKKE